METQRDCLSTFFVGTLRIIVDILVLLTHGHSRVDQVLVLVETLFHILSLYYLFYQSSNPSLGLTSHAYLMTTLSTSYPTNTHRIKERNHYSIAS